MSDLSLGLLNKNFDVGGYYTKSQMDELKSLDDKGLILYRKMINPFSAPHSEVSQDFFLCAKEVINDVQTRTVLDEFFSSGAGYENFPSILGEKHADRPYMQLFKNELNRNQLLLAIATLLANFDFAHCLGMIKASRGAA